MDLAPLVNSAILNLPYFSALRIRLSEDRGTLEYFIESHHRILGCAGVGLLTRSAEIIRKEKN